MCVTNGFPGYINDVRNVIGMHNFSTISHSFKTFKATYYNHNNFQGWVVHPALHSVGLD